MIELAIYCPTKVSGFEAYVDFSAEYRGHLKDRHEVSDLAPAIPYIERAISDRDGVISVDTTGGTNADVSVTFNPALTSWKRWYITVIDAIMDYYAENFDGVREIVHHTESSSAAPNRL